MARYDIRGDSHGAAVRLGWKAIRLPLLRVVHFPNTSVPAIFRCGRDVSVLGSADHLNQRSARGIPARLYRNVSREVCVLRLFAALLMMVLSTNACLASVGEDQANSFANLYLRLCMRHVTNLEALRILLRPLPTLPPDQAEPYVSGRTADIWPVPDKHGTFLLAISRERNICFISGRRADTEATVKLFTKLVATAPPPLISVQVQDERGQTPAGETHTLAYTWSLPGERTKMLFTLTTAKSQFARLQVLGSAAFVTE